MIRCKRCYTTVHWKTGRGGGWFSSERRGLLCVNGAEIYPDQRHEVWLPDLTDRIGVERWLDSPL